MGGIYIAALVYRYWHSLPTIYSSIVANYQRYTGVVFFTDRYQSQTLKTLQFSRVWHIDTNIADKEGEKAGLVALMYIHDTDN